MDVAHARVVCDFEQEFNTIILYWYMHRLVERGCCIFICWLSLAGPFPIASLDDSSIQSCMDGVFVILKLMGLW